MRCCRQKNHPPLWISGEPRQKLETLLPPLVRADACMRLIDDHEVWTGARKAFAALLCLNVVEADHREGIGVKQGLGERQAALQPARGAGRDSDGVDPESGLQLSCPLLDKMRWAQHR